MTKWDVVLSTTGPYNHVGIIKVRQGNTNTETMTAMIVENGVPVDLTGHKATLQTVIGKYPVERGAQVTDGVNGIVTYTFDEYTMQIPGKHTANIAFYKGEDLIGTTQDFNYFVIQAVSKTPGEMGSYWQTVDDLIADMTEFINTNQGDFTSWINARKKEFENWRDAQETDYLTWFNSIKDILKSIDPGGVMLAELMEARVDIQGMQHPSITQRLTADMEYIYNKLRYTLFTLDHYEISVVTLLQDDNFSENHETEVVGSVEVAETDGALIIATIDDPRQNVFELKKVGEI
ncbi:DUF2479 domain-containing protein [Erwinia sp. CPCC 100877]|nr:DUF2479 domain-containing protein [Erwinia sp. CPCC 100877]